ncbi:pyruvate, phosphate dikinase [Paenibacillus sp. GCM10027626]|uniref:pyruvate, phosphate dikinase n=1 Tax=Paenibacillus sp. GCM10027626 TaxID=3273411 RepID=UPI00362F3DF6
MEKLVFLFREGNAKMKNILGGKGANLAEMTLAGLPVPPGFTISTAACHGYFEAGDRLPAGLEQQMSEALAELERMKGQLFGDPRNPLLISVRSGSVTSMPGMMDTILNLGMNDETVAGLASRTDDWRFAYDCYRRLIQMFGNVVFGIESHDFELLLRKMKQETGASQDQDVSAEGWQRLIEQYKQCYMKRAGRPFPQDVHEQLRLAVEAVFKSWNNPRAKVYRKVNRIPDNQGTAVNIQSMVYGNKGDDSGTGVLFTRNPSTGENHLFGEYLVNAQGEDVVAGVRTPLPIEVMRTAMPALFEQLSQVAKQLEDHYRDMQDIEFTVEAGRLYMLQTRNGKRTAQAALRIAAELVREGKITKEEAVSRIEMSHLDQLLHRGLQDNGDLQVMAAGLPASPGAAAGILVFDADAASEMSRSGKRVILARPETTPEDIHGLLGAEGVLTSRGGMTSHAAVVARGMGKPCVCGCEAIRILPEEKRMETDQITVREGEWVTLDGTTGRVIIGEAALREAEMTEELKAILQWADEIRTLKVYANADNPADAQAARQYGAQGIGLCRTEHMFFAPERLTVVQQMILASSPEERKAALEKLLPMQQEDFEGIFRAMDGLPVTIRLLDPPLHEFLPSEQELGERLAELGEASQDGTGRERQLVAQMLRKVRELHEVNPMLGQRGCRLGIVYPEIYDMQVEAIVQASLRCQATGITVHPEIMIPLVGHANELKMLRESVEQVAAKVIERAGQPDRAPIHYTVGTMIEVPRAALTAKQIAAHADFFSFGTNDLTQMTFGYSRDDAENKFLAHYVDQKLLPHNPFQVLDADGVGQLIELAVNSARAAKPSLKTGICGEHGGDKESIFFCYQVGLDYVSCSPYRIPLARIAAAQAYIALGAPDGQRERLEINRTA